MKTIHVYKCIWDHGRCTEISSVRKSANARVRNFYAYENFCDYSTMPCAVLCVGCVVLSAMKSVKMLVTIISINDERSAKNESCGKTQNIPLAWTHSTNFTNHWRVTPESLTLRRSAILEKKKTCSATCFGTSYPSNTCSISVLSFFPSISFFSLLSLSLSLSPPFFLPPLLKQKDLCLPSTPPPPPLKVYRFP